MMILRSALAVVRQSSRPGIGNVAEWTSERFRVGLTDIDLFRHLNHARYLNYMEVARWGLMARSGFLRLSIRRGWIAPLRAVQVEYYRPLTLGRRFEIRTRFVRFEERWFHIVHRVFSADKEMARALIRGTVRKGRENVAPDEYLAPLGFHPADARIPDDVAEWVERKMRALQDA
jgi:YbgC/YbaW family acyl-CoA thioester hydrolase